MYDTYVDGTKEKFGTPHAIEVDTPDCRVPNKPVADDKQIPDDRQHDKQLQSGV